MMAFGMVALMGVFLLLDKHLLPLVKWRFPSLTWRTPRTDP